MNDVFQQIVSSLSVFGSTISIIATIVSLWLNMRHSSAKLQNAEKERFEIVLASDDITTLGNYLDNTLGKFNIYEYSSNSQISSRVDKYLDRIKDFVGTVESIEAEKDTPEPDIPETIEQEIPKDFIPILEELRTGEPWNALARLRRLIEITIRELAHYAGFQEKGLHSANYMLKLVARKLNLNPNLVGMLSYSISVCNKAIHGTDVSAGEAEEAIFAAAKALPELKSHIETAEQ
ncbi:MAG: hypothetical protein PHN75_04855 [Syntrophales bacterium]|nr:hypothetical protein [Syntrophales bacterium]